MSNRELDLRAVSRSGRRHEFLIVSDNLESVRGFSQSRKLTKIDATRWIYSFIFFLYSSHSAAVHFELLFWLSLL